MNYYTGRKKLIALTTCVFISLYSYSSQGGDLDTDNDGVPDSVDNCTLVPNPDQRDTDNDGYGNICDPDINNDGLVSFLDMAGWIPLFGTACGDVDEDFNGDGYCNFGDYFLFQQFFIQPPGPAAIDN